MLVVDVNRLPIKKKWQDIATGNGPLIENCVWPRDVYEPVMLIDSRQALTRLIVWLGNAMQLHNCGQETGVGELPHFVGRKAGGDHRSQRVCIWSTSHKVDRTVDQTYIADGSGRAQLHHQIWQIMLIVAQPNQGVSNKFIVSTKILSKFGRPNKWHFGTSMKTNVGDFFIIRSQDYTINRTCLQCMVDGVNDHRFAPKNSKILAWHALGTTTRWYQR